MGRLTVTTSGDMASFRSVAEVPVRSLKAHFLPVHEGSGDPSTTNHRPILDISGLKLCRKGKNLISMQDSVTYRAGYNEYFWGVKDWATKTITDGSLILPPGTYTFSVVNATANPAEWRVKDKDGNYIDHAYGGHRSRTFVNPETQPIALYVNCPEIGTGVAFAQLECGSVSSYEPYHGDNYTIDWSGSVGQVSGGYIDVITGDIYAEWRKIKISDMSWHNYSGGLHWYTGVYYGGSQDIYAREPRTHIYSDTLTPRVDGSFTRQALGEFTYYGEGVSTTSYAQNIWVKLPEATMDGTEANTWIKTTYPDAYLCYKLATPMYIGSVDPLGINTFIGYNHIWNTSSKTEVTYDFAESSDMLKLRRKFVTGRG